MRSWKCKLKISKSQNIKIGTGRKNVSNPKFITPKAIINPKTFESKLNWN